MNTQNILEVRDIFFSYGNDEVLSGISLDVPRGDYLGIIGPNGAGKTTLLKIILGLLVPSKGLVHLFGEDVKCFRAWRKVGYVPQKVTNFDANFPATVYEVALMGRYAPRGLLHSATQGDKQLALRALAQVGMEEYRNRLIGDLSGGQQQRVFIARALAAEPEIMFLDEPTTGVDPKTRDEFYALLKTMNRDLGITLVLISHDIDRVLQEVKHIACVDRTLVCHDVPEEFAKHSGWNTVFRSDVKMITHHPHQ